MKRILFLLLFLLTGCESDDEIKERHFQQQMKLQEKIYNLQLRAFEEGRLVNVTYPSIMKEDKKHHHFVYTPHHCAMPHCHSGSCHR